ncbi:MAG: LysM peptidoglycan-binding domain-containing protein, partial [Lachnospiraceae bacterium]|nr:LysM peptidoglycan-binding domain-containing protein [Lachnospiraceae bacterium]
ILDLPGSRDIVADFTEEDIEFFSTYEEMTEEQLDAINREQALLQEYGMKQLEAAMVTVEIDGVSVGFADLEAAAVAGTIDADTYYAKHMELADKQNTMLGELYIRLAEVRREIASLYGYDNYNDYMYEAYGRDYTPDEIQKFSDSVKNYLSEPYYYMQNLMDWNADCLYLTFSADDIMEILSTYIPQTSIDLQDGLSHLIDNKLYDIDYSNVKMSGAFTSYIPYYNTECIIMQPNANTYDLLTMVHEFGHFNADYQQGSTSSIDVAEVQSQGLEFLFMEHYEDIFGEEAASTIEEYVTLQQVYSFISGCLNNELETWAYTQENLTLDALNAKHAELLQAYEHMPAGTWTLEYYSKLWVQTPHYFTSPCYYISYATSVAGAFAIRELALENPSAAVNAYLSVATADTDLGFSEVMEDAGLGDVLAPEQIQAVGESLMETFDLEKRFMDKYFPEQSGPQTGDEEPGEEEPGEDEPSVTQKTCHVRKGDTLSKIGKRFQVDWREIAELNGIKAPYKIYAGQELLLPDNAVMTPEKVVVQKGDTLGKIAAALGLNWTILAEQLGLKAPYTIYAGEELEFIY